VKNEVTSGKNNVEQRTMGSGKEEEEGRGSGGSCLPEVRERDSILCLTMTTLEGLDK